MFIGARRVAEGAEEWGERYRVSRVAENAEGIKGCLKEHAESQRTQRNFIRGRRVAEGAEEWVERFRASRGAKEGENYKACRAS